ncbi:MAG: hypothetical protein ABR577_14250 [Pyrinomonadaceae bacterium]
MKQLKLTAAATVLTLALSFSAFAGEMYTGFVDVPPQTTSAATTTSSTSSTVTAVDPVTQLLLLLLNLLPRS